MGQADAAVFFRDGRAHPAKLGDFLPEAAVEGLIALQDLPRLGVLFQEAPRLIAQHALIVGKVEIHGAGVL